MALCELCGECGFSNISQPFVDVKCGFGTRLCALSVLCAAGPHNMTCELSVAGSVPSAMCSGCVGVRIQCRCAHIMKFRTFVWNEMSLQVAIKRSNVLMSVMVGGLVFRESITRRLPYVILMLAGMICIIVDPKT